MFCIRKHIPACSPLGTLLSLTTSREDQGPAEPGGLSEPATPHQPPHCILHTTDFKSRSHLHPRTLPSPEMGVWDSINFACVPLGVFSDRGTRPSRRLRTLTACQAPCQHYSPCSNSGRQRRAEAGGGRFTVTFTEGIPTLEPALPRAPRGLWRPTSCFLPFPIRKHSLASLNSSWAKW